MSPDISFESVRDDWQTDPTLSTLAVEKLNALDDDTIIQVVDEVADAYEARVHELRDQMHATAITRLLTRAANGDG